MFTHQTLWLAHFCCWHVDDLIIPMANSVDPEQSDQGLHCLSKPVIPRYGTCFVYFSSCRYMTDILPITDWSQEAVRPALNLILRRLDRLFSKISKSSSLKVGYYLSWSKTKPTKWPVRQAKTQIRLAICPVWSESSLSAWRRFGSLTTHKVPSKESDPTGWMPRLIWVFAGCTGYFVGFVVLQLNFLKWQLAKNIGQVLLWFKLQKWKCYCKFFT